MTASSYTLHGLSLRTDLDLGRPDSEGLPVDVDVHVQPATNDISVERPLGKLIAELVDGGRRYYSASVQDDRIVLRVHGLCEFTLRADHSQVECRPAPSANREQLALVTRGLLVSFILGLRHACVLHASVIETDHGTVAFVGSSGMGKSTMAGLACRDGARFVSDDVLRLGDGAKLNWVGCSTELRLRPAAASLADGNEEAWSPRETVDGRLAVSPPRTAAVSGSIDAMVIPSPTTSGVEVVLHQVEPLAATFLLAGFPRVFWLLPSALTAQFDGASRVANAVPVYQASIPWGPPFAEGLGAAVLRQVLSNYR